MKHVVIIGAGPAGLSCAIALRRAGVEVTLVERVSRARTVVDAGGGYELTGRALQALQTLGAREGVESRSQLLSSFELRSAGGGVLQSLDFEAARLPVLSVTRSQLVTALWEQLDPLGCTVLEEKTIQGAERRETGLSLSLSGGERLDADVLVGADGVHSEVRRRFFDERPAVDLEISAWWGRSPGEGREGAQGVVAPGVSFVRARGPGGGFAWTVCARTASLEEAAARLPSDVQAMVRDATSVASTRLLEQRPLKTWWREGVLLLGDSAHGMAPFLGLGANLALEDAVLFAGAFVRGEALEVLARRRAREVNPLIGQARRLAASTHFENGLAHALWCGVTRLVPSSLVLRSMRARHAR